MEESSPIELILKKRRSMERAIDDLRARFTEQPYDPVLGRMIKQLETELAARLHRPRARSS